MFDVWQLCFNNVFCSTLSYFIPTYIIQYLLIYNYYSWFHFPRVMYLQPLAPISFPSKLFNIGPILENNYEGLDIVAEATCIVQCVSLQCVRYYSDLYIYIITKINPFDGRIIFLNRLNDSIILYAFIIYILFLLRRSI